MLNVTIISGPAACGKTVSLGRIAQALRDEGRQVVVVDVESTARGIAQLVARYVNNPVPIPRKGLDRFLPAFMVTERYPIGPVTILINDCPQKLIDQLDDAIQFDAYLVAVRPQ